MPPMVLEAPAHGVLPGPAADEVDDPSRPYLVNLFNLSSKMKLLAKASISNYLPAKGNIGVSSEACFDLIICPRS